MIGTRIRKILRDIWARKARTILISVSIFIGVFGTVTLFSMGDLLTDQLKEDLQQDRLAMIRAYLGLAPGATPDNDALLATLRNMDGVTTVEGQAVSPTYWKMEDEEDFSSSFLFSYTEPFEDIQLEPMRLVEGAYPVTGQQQIAVERRFADKYDLDVGDHLVFRALSSAQNGGVQEEIWTISGIAFFPYGYAGFNIILPENTLFATYEDAQHLTGSRGLSSVYARFEDFETADQAVDEFNATIASTSPYIPGFTFVEDPAKNSLIQISESTGNVLGSLGLLALIVSGFLVFNVLMAIITEQKQQIGVMKSLGATRFDNFMIYTGMALVYGIIGVIPGVLLGIPAGFKAAQGFAGTMNALIEDFDYSERALLLGIGVGLAVPVLAALIPVLNGTRVQIIDAITDLGISARYTQGPLTRLLNALPVPINVRQGLSNVLRKKWRMMLTIVTLLVAAGAFMGVFAVFASVDNILNEFFDTFQFHLIVSPSDSQRLDDVRRVILDEVDGLTWRGPVSNVEIRLDGFDKELNASAGPPGVFAYGYDPATNAFGITIESGDPLGDDPANVVVARPTADELNKQVGDTITIHAGGHSGDYRISGIVSYPYDIIWMNWPELSRLAGLVDADGIAIPTGLLFSMDSADPTAGEVDDVIENINEVLLEHGYTATYENMELFTETISETVAMFQMIFNFTALLIALVGAVGLLSTLSMSVYERQKEIGVMRSIGAGSGTIITQFLTEGIFVGLLAWLIGLPLSYVLSSGLIAAMDLGDAYVLEYPPFTMLVGLVGMIVITTLASIWPSISAARKTVSDILRYQ